MNKEILKEIKRIKGLSDFELREQLRGYGFIISHFIHQFYKTEDKEYIKSYRYVLKKLKPIYEKANKGIKVFNSKTQIQNKKGLIFNYEKNFEERTEEEVLRRIKEKDYYNYYSQSRRKINNPIFKEILIKELNKNAKEGLKE